MDTSHSFLQSSYRNRMINITTSHTGLYTYYAPLNQLVLCRILSFQVVVSTTTPLLSNILPPPLPPLLVATAPPTRTIRVGRGTARESTPTAVRTVSIRG